jgi:hypothetical protein
VCLERKTSELEAEASSTLLFVSIEFVLKRNAVFPSGFLRGRNAHFGPNWPI